MISTEMINALAKYTDYPKILYKAMEKLAHRKEIMNEHTRNKTVQRKDNFS